ncbi:hypothetical protein HYFRA_00003624 [Hymenoscyphus fraxineus]|uniref:Uncharacterized protein n=1 Tax=Hymenoscyphus fraxineus TaxID=746836 RepID=A0A9N9KZB9_9HELO|nr:hypothetical protein HYFRA_00003624 [Hymenoscyphus fraxineus]
MSFPAWRYNGNQPPTRINPYERLGSLWTWSQHQAPKFEPMSGIACGFSCFRYSSSSIQDEISEMELKESDMDAWLNTPVPIRDGKSPTDGYKILLLIEDVRNLDIHMKFKTLVGITKAFKLPPVELNGIFRYDPATNLTMGYMVASKCFVAGLNYFEKVQYQYSACAHPLLIPIAILELMLENMIISIEGENQSLTTIERETGFSAMSLDEKKVENWQPLVRKLGEVHTYYLNYQTGVKTIQMAAGSHLKHLDVLYRSLPEERRERLKSQTLKLGERLEYLSSAADHAAVYGNMLNRLQAQQLVLFNLIAQEDNKINTDLSKDTKELATASKHDSSALKVVAFLTTLFLPGTFVATFFAMPLFNWESPSIWAVTTAHYWFYWIVTGPLTAVTMIVVLFWAMRQRPRWRSGTAKPRRRSAGLELGRMGLGRGKSGMAGNANICRGTEDGLGVYP